MCSRISFCLSLLFGKYWRTWLIWKKNKMDVQKSEIRIDLKMFSQEPTVDLTLDFSRDIPSGGGGWGGYLFAGYTHLNKYRPFDQSDYEYETLSVLSARTRTSVILAGKRGSRRHSTTSFSENVMLADTSDKVLEVLLFCGWEIAYPPFNQDNSVLFRRKGCTMKQCGVSIIWEYAKKF